MVTVIILERHGQSIGNNDKIYLNHTDLGLSEKGSIQAELTAGRFAIAFGMHRAEYDRQAAFMPNAACCTLSFDGEKLIPEKYFYAEYLAKLYTDSVLQKKQTLVTTPAFL